MGTDNQNGNLTFFYPTFFLLQLNPTNMKRILHLASVKNVTFKTSYNWFKFDILRLDRVRKSARRASGCIATSATTATGMSELFSLWENNLQPGRLSGPPGNQKTYNTIHKTFQYTLTFSRRPRNFADHLENIKTI